MPTDRQLVASKQQHEIAYFRRKYGLGAKVIRPILELVGRSRKKIMAKLIELGLIEKI